MPRDPFELAFLAGFGAYVIVRGVYEHRGVARATRERHLDGLERALLALVAVGCMLLPLLHLFTPWLVRFDYALPWPVRGLGLALLVGALWVFWCAHRDLGTQFSRTLELKQAHVLVTHGVYARVRHPMYLGIWLFSLAQALLLANAVAGPSGLAAFAPMYLLRVPREERMLRRAFGEVWTRYAAATPRLVPRLRR